MLSGVWSSSVFGQGPLGRLAVALPGSDEFGDLGCFLVVAAFFKHASQPFGRFQRNPVDFLATVHHAQLIMPQPLERDFKNIGIMGPGDVQVVRFFLGDLAQKQVSGGHILALFQKIERTVAGGCAVFAAAMLVCAWSPWAAPVYLCLWLGGAVVELPAFDVPPPHTP